MSSATEYVKLLQFARGHRSDVQNRRMVLHRRAWFLTRCKDIKTRITQRW